jgi:hypothetical protein
MTRRIPDESRESRNLKGLERSCRALGSDRPPRDRTARFPRSIAGFDIPESAGYHRRPMATRDKNRYQHDPSETRLRVMMEARQHELDAHRQRTSRTFSMILVGAIFLTTGAIWLFPASPVVSRQVAATPATPFTPAPSAGGSAENPSTGDPRFAMTTPKFVNPSPTAEVRTAAKAVSNGVSKATVSIP